MKRITILIIFFFLCIIDTCNAKTLEYVDTYNLKEVTNYVDMTSINGSNFILNDKENPSILKYDEEKNLNIKKELSDIKNPSFINFNDKILVVGENKNALKLIVLNEYLQIENQMETNYILRENTRLQIYTYKSKAYLLFFDEINELEKNIILTIDSNLQYQENNLSSLDANLLKNILKGDYYLIRLNNEIKDEENIVYHETSYTKNFAVLAGNISDDLKQNAYLTIINNGIPKSITNPKYNDYNFITILNNKIILIADNKNILVYNLEGQLLEEQELEKNVENFKKDGNNLILINNQNYEYFRYDLMINKPDNILGTTNVLDRALPNNEVELEIIPNKGYEVEKIEIETALGEQIELINNKFTMPDEEVYIDVSYKAKVLNPETSDIILELLLVCIIVIVLILVFENKLKWLK